jgi:predicted deacetylase
MRKQKMIILLLVSAIIIVNGYSIVKGLAVFAHIKLHSLQKIKIDAEPAQLWIEVHDVSPGYGSNKLREITDILDKHKDASDRLVLFVIPNHGGNTPLSKYPEFVEDLKRLQENGYILGVHGYTHDGGLKNPEFNTNLSNGITLVSRAKEEFKRSGLVAPRYFAPPGWHSSNKVSKYLRSEFDFTYYAFFIDTSTGTLPYSTHEYTWYNINRGGLKKAKKDYLNSNGVFRLTIHLGAANSIENLEFLNQFISWVAETKN